MGGFEIVELEELSGKYTKIYSIIEDGCDMTLYEKFIEENQANFQDELNFIAKRIFAIGNKTGVIDSFF